MKLLRRCLEVFGICFGRQSGQWVVLTRRFPFIVLALGIGMLFAFGGFVYYTSTPTFCNTCHYIKPFVASWKSSTHSMVTCNKCHFPPGFGHFVRGKFAGLAELVKTVTKTHGPKPHAEVENAACLRGGGHETRLLEGKVLFKGKYEFDHVTHLTRLRRGKQLRCTSCHSQIVQGEHMTVTESVCFTCHFKGRVHERVLDPIAGCTSCHAAPVQPVELAQGETFEHQPFLQRGVPCWKCHFDAVQGTGDVPRQVCLDCHGEADKLVKYADSEFMHDLHVTRRKVECFQCHGEIRHGLKPEPHAGKISCATCHSAGHTLQEDMFAGRGGKGAGEMPSRHSLRQVDCVACHEVPAFEPGGPEKDMVTYEATEKPCLECHGSGVEGMLDMWKTALSDALADAKREVARAQEAYTALPPDCPGKAEVKALLDEAILNCDFVEKAHGVHNPGYTFELLDRAVSAAEEAARIADEVGATQAAPEEEPR